MASCHASCRHRITLWALLMVGFAPQLAAAEPSRAMSEGAYVYAGGERESTALSAAIDGLVGRMSVLVRNIARSRLVERVIIAPRVAISRRGRTTLLSHEPLPPRPITSDGEPVGKRLDFLLQEIQRETNTVNSKSGDLDLSRRALALKAEVEKVREQVQNLE